MGPVMSSLLTVRQGSFQQVSRFMGTSSWCGTLAVQQASALIVNDTLWSRHQVRASLRGQHWGCATWCYQKGMV